jgi:hypothetical protein
MTKINNNCYFRISQVVKQNICLLSQHLKNIKKEEEKKEDISVNKTSTIQVLAEVPMDHRNYV